MVSLFKNKQLLKYYHRAQPAHVHNMSDSVVAMYTCCENNSTEQECVYRHSYFNLSKSHQTLSAKTNRLMCHLSGYYECVCERKWDAWGRRVHLVVFRGGDEEEDGGDRVEALKPAPPLRPLPSHIHHLEGNVLDLEVILVDALGGFTGQQDVLLTGKIILEERRKDTMNGQRHVQKMNMRKHTITRRQKLSLLTKRNNKPTKTH